MNVYRSYVTMIGEPGSKDESKLQAAQEINENLEVFLIHCFLMFAYSSTHLFHLFIAANFQFSAIPVIFGAYATHIY